ncbi:MAG: hypothetical protein AAGA65_17550 [Actinomycetota bacterium]
MTWLYALIWIPLVVCFGLGVLLATAWWLWRRRAVNAEYEKRRLAAEAESDRLRLRVSSLKRSEARADDLQLELEKARIQSARVPKLEGELKELRVQLGLVTELENQIINLRTRADQADRLERKVADLEAQLAAIAPAPEPTPEADAVSASESAVAPAPDSGRAAAPDPDPTADVDVASASESAVAPASGTESAPEPHAEPTPDTDAAPAPDPDPVIDLTDAENRGPDGRTIDLVEVNHRDDLQVIKGIGPSLEAKLHGMGITTWEQLAALTDEDVAAVGAGIAIFPGRIKRDQWVEQAAALVSGHPLTEPYNRPTNRAR